MKIIFIALALVGVISLYIRPQIFNGRGLASTKEESQQVTSTPPKNELAEVSIFVSPEKFVQGELAMVSVNGTSMDSTSSPQAIKSITFNGKALGVFSHNGKPSALIPFDLRMTTGTYPLIVTFLDGTTIKKNLVVGERVIVKEEFHIPEKLGGDTKESEQNLINTLVQEGAIINAIPIGPEKLWDGAFRFPVESVTITDTYGYSRETGGSNISHKGTDFRAAVGTSVYAMNSGRVAYTGYLRNYGHTVVVDHGLGVQTIYMHLAEVLVKNGDAVTKWQLKI